MEGERDRGKSKDVVKKQKCSKCERVIMRKKGGKRKGEQKNEHKCQNRAQEKTIKGNGCEDEVEVGSRQNDSMWHEV